jgi:hypothetical protein
MRCSVLWEPIWQGHVGSSVICTDRTLISRAQLLPLIGLGLFIVVCLVCLLSSDVSDKMMSLCIISTQVRNISQRNCIRLVRWPRNFNNVITNQQRFAHYLCFASGGVSTLVTVDDAKTCVVFASHNCHHFVCKTKCWQLCDTVLVGTLLKVFWNWKFLTLKVFDLHWFQ